MKKLAPLPRLALACLATALLFVSCDPNDDDDDATTIVCLGDSLTAGMSATVVGQDDAAHSYPAYLKTMLNEDPDTAYEVINAGKSGDTAAEGGARLNADVLAKDPAAVIVCLGANDLLELGSDATQEEFSAALQSMAEDLGAIVGTLDDGERKVLLAKFYTEDAAQGLLDYNGITVIDAATFTAACDQAFAAIMENASANVVLMEDIWDGVWGVQGMMSTDGIHPTAAGNEVMAENYLSALAAFGE